MEAKNLQWLRISSKGFKKQLLIPPRKIPSFNEALCQHLEREFLVINTNVGLDLYFYKQATTLELLIKSYCQFASEPLEFRIQFASTEAAVKIQMEEAFLRLSNMPLLFKSYTYSLCAQLNQHFLSAQTIIVILFDIWHSLLFKTIAQGNVNQNTLHFLTQLQLLYHDKNLHPLLKELLKNAIDDIRQN